MPYAYSFSLGVKPSKAVAASSCVLCRVVVVVVVVWCGVVWWVGGKRRGLGGLVIARHQTNEPTKCKTQMHGRTLDTLMSLGIVVILLFDLSARLPPPRFLCF